PYVPIGVAAVVVLILLFAVFSPSARVDIQTTAVPVSATPTITGQPTAPGPSDSLAVQTDVIDVSEASGNPQSFPATGQMTVPGNKSTGQVVFTNDSLFAEFDLP